MSKFKIYRIDLKDPKIIGRQNKRLIFGYSILSLLTMLMINSHILRREHNISRMAYFAILSSLILITLYFVFKIKRQLKQIKNIGTLEFTKTSIRKEIKDLRSEYPLDKIFRIELEKHIKAISVFGNKRGYMTYIIKIINLDSQEDQFVISELSSDFQQKISIIDTLKTLEKISGLKIVFK
jgi:hypothetical protein